MKITDAIKNYNEIKHLQDELKEYDLKLGIIGTEDNRKGYLTVNQNDVVLEFTELEELQAFMTGVRYGYGSKMMEEELESFKKDEFGK